MQDKSIKLVEINHLQERGAKIHHEPREVIVNGLESIAEQIGALGNKDLLIAVKGLTDVIASKEMEVKVDAVDLAPLVKALEERKPPSYLFTIERDERGRMASVTAEPTDG